MSKHKEIRGRRILVYYMLAIVLPCIVLGILAFRGIRNDRALIEKENRRSLLEVGERLSTMILNRFDTIEQSFLQAVSQTSVPDKLFFSDSLLAGFLNSQPLLTGIYYLRSPGELYALQAPFLYFPDHYVRDQYKPLPALLSTEMDKGWEYEFRSRNFARAIRYYRALLARTSVKEEKSVVLNTLARLYRKAGDLPAAMRTYQQIIDDCPDVYLPGGIHVGLSSSRELIKLGLSAGDVGQAEKEQCKLLGQFLKREWKVSQSQLVNTLAEVNGQGGLENSYSACGEAETDLERFSERTKYLLGFMDLGDEISRMGRSSPVFYLQDKGHEYLLCAVRAQSGEWILLFDPADILDLSIKPALVKGAKELRFEWEIRDRADEHVAGAVNTGHASSLVRYTLTSGLPPWTIVFFHGKSGLLDSFLNTGKGLYFFIFLLIIVILAFGLFFTLNTVNQEIRLSRMKSHFISTVSHEFKSPLTSIRQMAEMLDRGRVRSDERRRAYYSSMLHQSERLSHLIENILDFSRMEDGRKQYQFESGNLAHLVESVFNTFGVQLKEQGYELRLEASEDIPETHFDHEAMEQVMHNLLDNAVKYSGTQKRIDLEVYRKKDAVVISVRDYGIGIPKRDQEKIFTRFYRAGDALTSKIKGSGIGLTIVRQIVEAHGGKVSVLSKQGQGSTFHLHLPIQQES